MSKTKQKKNWNKIWIITLLVLLALEITLIPCLIFAEVKKLLPVIFFLILPTLFGILVLLLSRTCVVDYNNKKKNIKR